MRSIATTPPVHGGDLIRASQCYGIELSDWLDLSTGINPVPYPYTDLPVQALQHLPYLQPAFIEAAEKYYGNGALLAVAGTQTAIYALPGCLSKGCLSRVKVLLPDTGYQEHRFTWLRAGAGPAFYSSLTAEQAARDITTALSQDISIRYLVVINPNNPTGTFLDTEQLRQWADILDQRQGHLIVDEAFIDATPKQSILAGVLPGNVVVLRSFGKFFGLAGVRLGFVAACRSLLDKLAGQLPCWQVNGVAQAVAIQALQDHKWQRQMRATLLHNQVLMQQLFADLWKGSHSARVSKSPLFLSLLTGCVQVEKIHNFFARAGVLTRVIPVDEQSSILRIGTIDFTRLEIVERVKAIVNCYQD